MKSRSGRLRQGRLRTGKTEEMVNPMDGVANLADAMLVFACGLLLSLIINWNVDVGRTEKLVGLNPDTQLTEMSETETKNPDDLVQGEGYEEMGVVYRDSSTGKLYVVSREKE